jgi:nucleoside-diphosphate-sugar epimerase
MLEHRNSAPRPPARAVIIGARGFVAGAVARRLQREAVPILTLDREDIDLLAPDAADRLRDLLRPIDALVVDLALPPVKTARMLADHLVMVRAVVEAWRRRPLPMSSAWAPMPFTPTSQNP